MRRRVLSVAVLSLATLSAAPTARAALVVTEVQSQTTAGTPGTINGDWWELTNTGPAAVNLAGFRWADTEDALGGPTPQPNVFPSVVINPGQSIIVLEEVAANEAAFRANWGLPASVVILGTDEMLPSTGVTDTFSGLSADGDAVFFYDPSGVLVSQLVFGSNAGFRGVTFEADTAGNDLGRSVVGENGAVLAGNGDVGSPGFAVAAATPGPAPVPEPASLLLVSVGAAVAWRFRRRAAV